MDLLAYDSGVLRPPYVKGQYISCSSRKYSLVILPSLWLIVHYNRFLLSGYPSCGSASQLMFSSPCEFIQCPTVKENDELCISTWKYSVKKTTLHQRAPRIELTGIFLVLWRKSGKADAGTAGTREKVRLQLYRLALFTGQVEHVDGYAALHEGCQAVEIRTADHTVKVAWIAVSQVVYGHHVAG